ncbi:ABC transporter substrate-binding protein [Angustibacter peucedani]
MAALSVVPAVAACNPDQKAATKTSDGLIANLNGGGFGGGANPQINFNPYSPTRLTTDYMFETLFIVNKYNCDPTPWLATDYSYSDDTHLVMTLRDGVKWSDGQAFGAEDVKYTFDMLKDHPELDSEGVWSSTPLKAVTAAGNKVTFEFSEPSSPAFVKISNTKIVPEHVWGKEKDPSKFVNKAAVGTGPFTFKSFNGQQLLLQRNPNYWQADKVKVNQLTFSDNGGGGDTDKLRLARGDYDFNSMFIADIEKTYVAKDKEHNKYWFPPGADISLYMNLKKAPFSDVGFRKALVYAVDREEISKKAEYGYVTPASQTGLVLPGQKDWLSSKYQGGETYGFDPAKTKQMMQEAGYTYDSSGNLLDKSGKPMKFTFKVQAGYLDWIAAAGIMKNDFKQVGIQLDVRTGAPTDVENDRAIGDYEMTFGVHGGQCTMYQNYDDPLGTDRTAPIGKKALANFVRWQDPTTDDLLKKLRTETDEAKQKEYVAGLQDIMVQQVPTIPLWYGAKFFQYRTEKAAGWPSADDPYAAPDDALLVLTHLTPPKS